MGLGAVIRNEAELVPRMREIAIAPPIVGGGEEDAVAQIRRRRDGALENLDDIALAQPDGEVARAAGPVLSVDAPDADTENGEPVLVGVRAPERLGAR